MKYIAKIIILTFMVSLSLSLSVTRFNDIKALETKPDTKDSEKSIKIL